VNCHHKVSEIEVDDIQEFFAEAEGLPNEEVGLKALVDEAALPTMELLFGGLVRLEELLLDALVNLYAFQEVNLEHEDATDLEEIIDIIATARDLVVGGYE
jgi:hypothetical protein